MDQYNQLATLLALASKEIKLYSVRVTLARENEKLLHEGNKMLRGKYESNLDLYSTLAQLSLNSYHAIMDEIESIHASNFTV
ncbi:hypothetical protein MMC2321_01908 [Chitinophaga sp. MM2321]